MTLARTLNTVLEPLQLLGAIARLASSGEQSNNLVYRILEMLVSNTGISGVWVLLPDSAGKLSIRYAHGLTEQEIRRGSYALDEGTTGRVMAEGRQIIVEEPGQDPDFVARIKTRQELNQRHEAWIGEPLIMNGETLGVLACLCRQPDVQAAQMLPTVATLLGQLIYLKDLSRKMDLKHREIAPSQSGSKDRGRETYGLLGKSAALSRAVDKARRAAASEAPVMLIGESGTGKERFARMIHLASDRRDKPFVGINCATIPENLLESELFGHEKGAFTGATSSRQGKFELASGGTLFLDEIGEMDLGLQAKLLRVLQEKTLTRLGSNRETPIDIRIITATNRNLENAVNVCTFRLDLYYRLNVVRILLPALRERGKDIRLLANYFLIRENQRQRRNILLSNDTMELLQAYPWPGNVRQLENFIIRLVIMTDEDSPRREEIEALLEEEAGIDIEADNTPATETTAATDDAVEDLRPYQRVGDTDRGEILDALKRTRGNKTAAARLLGMSPRQLQYRIQKLDL